MGVARSLRSVVERVGGFGEEDYYDDEEAYERALRQEEHLRVRRLDDDGSDFDEIYDEEPAPYRRSAPGSSPRPLALVAPRRTRFGLVAPQVFDEAQQIADLLRSDAPVIVDLQGCEAPLARRLIDFCSGLAYALEGSLELVEKDVLLVAPSCVDLSGEAARLRTRTFFNQA